MAAYTDEPPPTNDVTAEPVSSSQQDKPVLPLERDKQVLLQAVDTATPDVIESIQASNESPQSHSSSPILEQYSKDHTHSDESEGEDILGRSLEGGEVGQLLRATVEALEAELKESRQLLTQRDHELVRLRSDLERYKQQTAREIANKTRLAQALDDSHRHAREMEEFMQQWQMEVREQTLQGERMRATLQRQQSTSEEVQQKLTHSLELKDKEISEMKSQLIELRRHKVSITRSTSQPSSPASECNPGPETMDTMQLHFLKQAVYHLLTDFHAEDQLRAVVSLLDFSPQERKAVYAKQDRKRTPRT